MNKTDVLREMVDRVNDKYVAANVDRKATQKDIDFVLSAFDEMIKETLADNHDEKVSFGSLGSFKVKEVPERRGTILLGDRKGEEYVTPAHSEITFKMSKTAKQL